MRAGAGVAACACSFNAASRAVRFLHWRRSSLLELGLLLPPPPPPPSLDMMKLDTALGRPTLPRVLHTPSPKGKGCVAYVGMGGDRATALLRAGGSRGAAVAPP